MTAGGTVASLSLGGLARAQSPGASPTSRTAGAADRKPSEPPLVPWLDDIDQAEDLAEVEPSPLVNADGSRITTLAAWRTRRAELERAWREFVRPIPPIATTPPSATSAPSAPHQVGGAGSGTGPHRARIEILAEDTVAGVLRRRIRYENEPGRFLEAYLLEPLQGPRVDRPSTDTKVSLTPGRPGVVVFHSTTTATIRQPAGLAGEPEKAFGVRLAKAGMVALCPENFLWVGSGDLRSRTAEALKRYAPATGMAKMLFDAIRAVDVLAALPGVDTDRLGAVGHSLGAKEVLYLMAFDPRIKAGVFSEGGIGFAHTNWDADWYLGPVIRDRLGLKKPGVERAAAGSPRFTLDHHELLCLTAPRPLLVVGGDSADGEFTRPFLQAARAVHRLHGARPTIGLFNHRAGHSVPPAAVERIDGWMVSALQRAKG
jgi:hypothetical protein